VVNLQTEENRMKKTAIITVAATAFLALSGCQSFSAVNHSQSQGTFTAPSYLGRELPGPFIANRDKANQDDTHNLRGFRNFGRRHHSF